VKFTRTFEEFLHERLSRCGPVIAIGRPDEQAQPLGAPRFWVSNDKWQPVVEELLSESQYVIMVMGNLDALRQRIPPPGPGTPPGSPSSSGPLAVDGLTWEVRKVFGLRDLVKVIFLMPPVVENEACQRWEQYRELSRYRLPPYQGGELGAVFTADGRCWVLRGKLHKGWFKKRGYRRDLSAYKAILEVKP
jgi:hypothetical protein